MKSNVKMGHKNLKKFEGKRIIIGEIISCKMSWLSTIFYKDKCNYGKNFSNIVPRTSLEELNFVLLMKQTWLTKMKYSNKQDQQL